MVKIFINEKPVEAEEGTTVLNAAEKAGIPIPHLCYHSAFEPEGSCRMCLVEIEGLPKLELACSTKIREGMKIFTHSPKVIEARKGVLEFLLAEHPLDCPICDKAGECKLQDYYEEYGLFESQFDEVKKKREKKIKIGKNLILDQERCILCTRCVRFLREVTKTQELGVFNRGIKSEIDIYDGFPVNNNYSGNLTELCPVGAITDSDFRFKTRSWFLEKGESICPLCSRGCNIFVEYHRGFPRFPVPRRVYRIRSRENPEVNGHFICDFGRYGYSYLDEDRLDKLVVNNSGDKMAVSWENIILLLTEKIKRLYYMKRTSRIALIINTWLSNEELFLIDKIFRTDLDVKKIFFVEPAQGEEDDFLLTSERTPNRRGAKELGFNLKPLDPEILGEGTELLLTFGSYPSESFNFAELKTALEAIKTKLFFTPYINDLNSHFDIILPTAQLAEKEGSITNLEGKVQKFNRILEPLGESQPEWKIMVELAKNLGMNFKYYRHFSHPEFIFQEISKDISFFRKSK